MSLMGFPLMNSNAGTPTPSRSCRMRSTNCSPKWDTELRRGVSGSAPAVLNSDFLWTIDKKLHIEADKLQISFM
jgi:hypothetical protein